MTLTLRNNMPFFGFTNNMLLVESVESVDLLEREREREREEKTVNALLLQLQHCICAI